MTSSLCHCHVSTRAQAVLCVACRVKLHERRAAVAAAPQAAAAEQGVAPLPSVVVNTVAALPEPSQLPPVTPAVVAAAVAAMPPAVEVAAARAAAFQKSASMGSALHHPGLQRLQQQQAEKAAAPAAAEQAARQQQQQQRAAAAAHLKHSVPEAHTIDSSGGSFTALLQSARNRPGGPGDAGEPGLSVALSATLCVSQWSQCQPCGALALASLLHHEGSCTRYVLRSYREIQQCGGSP